MTCLRYRRRFQPLIPQAEADFVRLARKASASIGGPTDRQLSLIEQARERLTAARAEADEHLAGCAECAGGAS